MTKSASPAGEKLLSVRNIYKSFAHNAVLRGISMDLGSGEVLALIGGNGAGKSTLMKIIMGIYSHDSGEIVVNGREMTVGKPAEALANGVYMVPQEPLLFPNMTVEENILAIRRTPCRELHTLCIHCYDSDLPAGRTDRNTVDIIGSLNIRIGSAGIQLNAVAHRDIYMDLIAAEMISMVRDIDVDNVCIAAS